VFYETLWEIPAKILSRSFCGAVTLEQTIGSGEPRIPVRVIRVEISCHGDEEYFAQALGHVRLDQASCGREVACYKLYSSGPQN
jgi:hypothetical protein